MRPIALMLAPLFIGVAWPVSGQDLAAAASREKERREKAGKKAQTFTNDDLSKGSPKASPSPSPAAPDGLPMDAERLRRLGGGGSGASAPPAATGSVSPPSKPACEGSSCEDSGAAEGPSDEAGWRRRAEGLRDAVARADADVARVQKALDEVRRGQSQPLPIDAMRQVPLNPLTPPPDAERLTRELETAKAAAAAARQAVSDFEEEARRAGVPPGWLR